MSEWVICRPPKPGNQASQGPSRMCLLIITEQHLKLLSYTALTADGVKDDPSPR